MTQMEFKGSVSSTAEGFQLDKALFEAHPEFEQQARIRAQVIGPGSLLLTLDNGDAAEPADTIERDPVVSAYLSFLERDMIQHPERLRPFRQAEIDAMRALTAKIVVSDDEAIPDDITL